VLSFTRNFGQLSAIIAGMKETTADAVIMMAADQQEPVLQIPVMLEHWRQGSDIVICHRADREDGFLSRMTSAFFYRLIRISNPKMPAGGFDFILIDKKPLEVFNQIDERNRFFQGDILWLGFKTIFLPYHRLKRTIGRSQWSLSKKVKYFIDGFINTSYIPIRFMSLIGMVTALLGFMYAGLIAYNRLINNVPFKGWAPLMILILIIGGLIMLMLGIIGEYVWRTYDETRKRPLFIIQEKLIHES
jgi:dolichol-phosphate mannosyltransferase